MHEIAKLLSIDWLSLAGRIVLVEEIWDSIAAGAVTDLAERAISE